MKVLVTAAICPHCGNCDDLVPHPKTGASRRCPCPHDELTALARSHEATRRHRAAVARARRHVVAPAWRDRSVS